MDVFKKMVLKNVSHEKDNKMNFYEFIMKRFIEGK